MTPPSGLAGPKLWLVARYPKEPGKLIALGSILKDPENPESSLNRGHVKEIPSEDIFNESSAVRRSIEAELTSDTSVAFKAMLQTLFDPGVNINGKLSADAQTTVEALGVNAKIFIPRTEYMNASVQHHEVQKYIKKHHRSVPLYLIVGVATANKLSVKESQSREAAGAASLGVAPPGPGLDGAAEVSYTRRSMDNSGFEIKEECDFAYRVRKFLCWKSKKEVRDRGDRSHGTMFEARDSEPDLSDHEDEFEARFADFEDDDVSGSEGVLASFQV